MAEKTQVSRIDIYMFRGGQDFFIIGSNYLLPEPVFFGNLLCNGALAQLGERLHGMQEVVSSILIGSIINPY